MGKDALDISSFMCIILNFFSYSLSSCHLTCLRRTKNKKLFIRLDIPKRQVNALSIPSSWLFSCADVPSFLSTALHLLLDYLHIKSTTESILVLWKFTFNKIPFIGFVRTNCCSLPLGLKYLKPMIQSSQWFWVINDQVILSISRYFLMEWS